MDLPATSLSMVSQFLSGGLSGLTQSRGLSGLEEDVTCSVCEAPKSGPIPLDKDITEETSKYGAAHWVALVVLLLLAAGVGKAALRAYRGDAGPRGDKKRGKYTVLETIREETNGDDGAGVEMGIVNSGGAGGS